MNGKGLKWFRGVARMRCRCMMLVWGSNLVVGVSNVTLTAKRTSKLLRSFPLAAPSTSCFTQPPDTSHPSTPCTPSHPSTSSYPPHPHLHGVSSPQFDTAHHTHNPQDCSRARHQPPLFTPSTPEPARAPCRHTPALRPASMPNIQPYSGHMSLFS